MESTNTGTVDLVIRDRQGSGDDPEEDYPPDQILHGVDQNIHIDQLKQLIIDSEVIDLIIDPEDVKLILVKGVKLLALLAGYSLYQQKIKNCDIIEVQTMPPYKQSKDGPKNEGPPKLTNLYRLLCFGSARFDMSDGHKFPPLDSPERDVEGFLKFIKLATYFGMKDSEEAYKYSKQFKTKYETKLITPRDRDDAKQFHEYFDKMVDELKDHADRDDLFTYILIMISTHGVLNEKGQDQFINIDGERISVVDDVLKKITQFRNVYPVILLDKCRTFPKDLDEQVKQSLMTEDIDIDSKCHFAVGYAVKKGETANPGIGSSTSLSVWTKDTINHLEDTTNIDFPQTLYERAASYKKSSMVPDQCPGKFPFFTAKVCKQKREKNSIAAKDKENEELKRKIAQLELAQQQSSQDDQKKLTSQKEVEQKQSQDVNQNSNSSQGQGMPPYQMGSSSQTQVSQQAPQSLTQELFNSAIVKSVEQQQQLNALVPGGIISGDPLYSMKRDGGLEVMYSKCEGIGPTLFTFQADNGAIFFAYTNIAIQIVKDDYKALTGNGNTSIFVFKNNQLYKLGWKQKREVMFGKDSDYGYVLGFCYDSIGISDKDIKDKECEACLSDGCVTLPSEVEKLDDDAKNEWLVGKEKFGITDMEVFRCTGTAIQGKEW